jgi:hypothetical protein
MTNITMLAATRPRLLKQALASIGDLSNATVTIRDADMNDEVGDIIEYWSLPRVKTIPFQQCRPMGTGPARNETILKSERLLGRGDYLYLSDDDVYFLQHDWLKILTAAYDEAREQGFRVLGAYGHPFNRPCAPAIRLSTRWNIEEVYAVATQSMLMDWETWDEFGPFCDTPAGKVCQSEDVDFCNRVRAAGYKVGVISPALLVNTGITNSFGEHIPGWELVKSMCPENVICE